MKDGEMGRRGGIKEEKSKRIGERGRKESCGFRGRGEPKKMKRVRECRDRKWENLENEKQRGGW